MHVLFLPMLLGIVLALVISWPAIFLAHRIGLMDVPGESFHKTHSRATPRAGGMVLVVSLTIVWYGTHLTQDPAIRALFLGTWVIFVFGLWDDWKELSPLWKFVGQFLAASLVVVAGFRVHFFDAVFPGQAPWLNIGITLFWLVGESNAFNLIDSMDGLAVGLGAIGAGVFALGAFDGGQVVLGGASAVVMGIAVGIWFFNTSPARLFLGDSGSQSLGFLLAGIGMIYNPQGFPQMSSWFLPILVLGVPIFDTTLVVFSRLRRKQPVFRGNLDHTYHRLAALNIAPTRVVFGLHLLAIVLSAVAFVALNCPPRIANAIFGGVLLIGAGVLLLFEETPSLKQYLAKVDQRMK